MGDPVSGDQLDASDLDLPDMEGILPAPGGPDPPGPELDVPPIVPGDILPPPADGQSNPAPPGKINLPGPTGALPEPLQLPEQLRLHNGLSGGHRFDDELQSKGLYLVVNILDDRGRVVDPNDFDIDAKLTIVALDPELESDKARIGRWEFPASQLGQFIRSEPVAGLHVPVRWQQSQPSGEDVIVHVRLQSDDEEMLCSGRLKVSGPESIADWTPRSGKSEKR